jgi:hypothetical protein
MPEEFSPSYPFPSIPHSLNLTICEVLDAEVSGIVHIIVPIVKARTVRASVLARWAALLEQS